MKLKAIKQYKHRNKMLTLYNFNSLEIKTANDIFKYDIFSKQETKKKMQFLLGAVILERKNPFGIRLQACPILSAYLQYAHCHQSNSTLTLYFFKQFNLLQNFCCKAVCNYL